MANKPTFSFGSGGQSPFSLAATTTAQATGAAAPTPAPSFGFGASTGTATTSLFGSNTGTPTTSLFGTGTGTPTTSLFGTTAQTTTAAPSIGFSTPTTTAVASAPAAVASVAPTASFSFGSPATASPKATVAATTTTAAAAPTLPTLALPTTTASTGFNLGLGLAPAATTTAAAAPAISAATSTANTGGFANLSTATKTTDSSSVVNLPQMTYLQMEEHINKWTLELEEQEKSFTAQATQINAWDNILVNNNEKILELNEAVQKVRADQQTLEQELEFITTQHKELEESIVPLQKELVGMPQVDAERAQTYLLVETLDTQLKQMTEDLKEIIDHLNEANKGQDNTDPIIQIGKILNAHMTSLQWIENSTDQISNKLEDINKMHDTFKRENERSFRMAYYN